MEEAGSAASDRKFELERARIEADVRIAEARSKVRQVIYGTMIVGLAAAAFPFAQKLAELTFTERIETARLTVEETRMFQEDERARREFLNSLGGEGRSANIETRIILAEFFAHMAVKQSEREQWQGFLEYLNAQLDAWNEERRTLNEVVTGAATTAKELADARARLDQIARLENPDVRQMAPTGPGLSDLVAAAGETRALSDPRVLEAMRAVIEGTREDVPFARRLMAEAGYPDGFPIEIDPLLFPGQMQDLEDLRLRLKSIGVDLRISANR